MFLFALVSMYGCKEEPKGEKLDMNRAMPSENLYDQENIKQNFFDLKATPFDKPEMAFSLLVPKEFIDKPLKVSPDLVNNPTSAFVPLSEQLAPEDDPGHARIEVRFVKLDLELKLVDWVNHFLEASGYTVLKRKRGEYNGRKVEDVLVRVKEKGFNYVVRMAFSRHGNRIFLVACSAEEPFFNRYAKPFGAAVISFTPQNKSESPYAEPMTTYVNPGPPPLEFRYPKSWVRKEADGLPAGKVGVDLSLRANEKTVGFIHIKGISKGLDEFPDLIINKMRKDFKDAGVGFIAKTRTADLNPKTPGPLAKLTVWDVTVKGVPGEVAMLLLGNDEYFVALSLMMPERKKNPYAWMTAWRVFELIIEDVSKNLNQ